MSESTLREVVVRLVERLEEEAATLCAGSGKIPREEVVERLHVYAQYLREVVEQPTHDTQDDIDMLLERSVVELNLALHSRQALERGGFKTIGDLCRADASAVADAFGETSMKELLTRMDGLGLAIGVMPKPAKPNCVVCGHRSKYHGAGSCYDCACGGQMALAGIEVLRGDEKGESS